MNLMKRNIGNSKITKECYFCQNPATDWVNPGESNDCNDWVYICKCCQKKTITVCSSCHTACCWQGKFYCDDYQMANIEEKTIRELMRMGKEHPDHWRNVNEK